MLQPIKFRIWAARFGRFWFKERKKKSEALTLIDRCEVLAVELNASATNTVGLGGRGEGAVGAQRQKAIEHIVHFVEHVRQAGVCARDHASGVRISWKKKNSIQIKLIWRETLSKRGLSSFWKDNEFHQKGWRDKD